MTTKSQRTKGRDSALSSLNMALDALNRTEGATVITPAKAAFTSAGVLLTTIRVGFLVDVSRMPANMYTGLNGLQSRLCRTGANLRWRL